MRMLGLVKVVGLATGLRKELQTAWVKQGYDHTETLTVQLTLKK